MENRIFIPAGMPYGEYGATNDILEKALEEDERFAKVFERFDAMQETAQEREQRLKAEEAKALEKKKRQKKINDLQSLISQLRAKLASAGGKNSDLEARLSAAQTELYWLMFAF